MTHKLLHCLVALSILVSNDFSVKILCIIIEIIDFVFSIVIMTTKSEEKMLGVSKVALVAVVDKE